MADQHNQNFFGQKTGLIVSSNLKEEPFIFIRCLKKKKDGEWQKFEESKVIKLSLLEIVAISDVLNGKRKIWNTFHSFNESKTPISFAWDEHDSDLLWVNIDEYSRPLNYPETELMKRLIDHILEEKICYSTIKSEKSTKEIDEKSNYSEEESKQNIKDKKVEEKNKKPINKDSDFRKNTITPTNNSLKESEEGFATIRGKIKMVRDKAILIVMDSDEEIWLPKSTITNEFDEKNINTQNFLVKKWILEKRNSISAS